MPEVVWKFPLRNFGKPAYIEMPAGAEVLRVDLQAGHPHIWARVNPEDKTVRRWFVVVGTGHDIPESYGVYVGTFYTPPMFVWHVFERLANC